MLGSPILDLAIGMAFIYLLLSLIATVVQEIISSIMQARSANLALALHSLFSGDALQMDENGKSVLGFIKALYGHGLVRGLYRDPARDSSETKPPSRRPIGNFLRRVYQLQVPASVGAYDDFKLPAYIPSRTFAVALIDLLDDKTHGWDSLKSIEAHLLELKKRSLNSVALAREHGAQAGFPCDPSILENKAVEALLSLLEDAEGDATKFRSNVESWYNDAMDRASGWYKRYVQQVLMLVGLIIAVTLNVDSVRVAQTLWFDHDARQGLVTAATDYIQAHPNFQDPTATSEGSGATGSTGTVSTAGASHAAKSSAAQTQKTDTPVERTSAISSDAAHTPAALAGAKPSGDVPVKQEPTADKGSSGTPKSGDTTAGATKPEEAKSGEFSSADTKGFEVQKFENGLHQTIESFNKVSRESMLPVGWNHSPSSYVKANARPWNYFLAWVLAFFGWCITAGALSLGAPFWFDTLNKIMVVRSTVKPSEKSPNERSKD